MGGMSAQIPIKNDEVKNNAAMAKVHADKKREVEAGHDGTWVAHPALVPIALEEFNKGMVGPNQVSDYLLCRCISQVTDLLIIVVPHPKRGS